MKPLRAVALLLAFFVAMSTPGVFAAVLLSACTPAQVEVVQRAVPVVKAACVVVRAFTQEGDAKEACATIDELAPLLGEILERRKEAAPETVATVEQAIVLPAPKRRTPLRRCAQWVPVQRLQDASASDGSGSGSGVDGAP